MPPTNSAPATFTHSDFPKNAWYAAAWDTEVNRRLLPRTICGRHLVLYRRTDGVCVALENACWHRLLPLSQGRLEGDDVVCAYQGLIYNPQGRCVYMPSQETINPAACVRSYPVFEKHRFVWVWTGDPAQADPGKIPDLHWNQDPEWAGDGETIHVHCNYKLVLDNLMDLTHETFVHGSSLGHREIAEAPFHVTHGPNHATVTRWMHNVNPPPFWSMQLGRSVPCDRWQIITFEAPSTISIDVGVAPIGTGAPQGDRSQGVNGRVLNTVTPETDTSCHYFWAFVRNYKLQDQSLTTRLREGVHHVFSEDELILEAQQRAMNENYGRTFYNLNIDAGAMWARRLIDERIEAERTWAQEAKEYAAR